ncbi:urease accessory protein UreF [Collybia nuda]|uniref:Urease accessory protein UreF n=1 Tax=Collybia nuda TaxID=64659 RepID=A0A9P5Y789_9AGAR|nr:urease accessory protein UreF [Collybia nuda]
MNDEDEAYILLLLSDSNLPTGSFVASAGLESYVKHGFASLPGSTTTTFVRDNLASYARSALPFVTDAHRIVSRFRSPTIITDAGKGAESGDRETIDDLEWTTTKLAALDDLYDTMTLNHIARRASKSQGVALLTLFSKGFSRPSGFSVPSDAETQNIPELRINGLLEHFKVMVRKEGTHGHLPTCWGVLTAALGLSLERSQYLHLFLHARSLLSASVRLNNIGPYGAQQLLVHAIRPLVATETNRCKDLRSGLLEVPGQEFDSTEQGPANTWPLGEILAARHDLQHSRIFNS